MEIPHIPFYKKLASYLYPVFILKESSDLNPVLRLYLYRGQYQLATADALYSDGKEYRPLREAFSKLTNRLTSIANVLVLGTGIGSAVQILEDMDCHPQYTLVDIDSTVLRMALQLLPASNHSSINPVCADAAEFMAANKQRYDLLVVDVFIGREVPDFVLTTAFMQKCKYALNKKGIMVFNYITTGHQDFESVKKLLNGLFNDVEIIEFGINKVFLIRMI